MTGKHFVPLLARANAFAFVAGNDAENPRHASAISRHHAPELCTIFRPSKRRRRECRMPDAPAASCVKCKTHELVTTGSPEESGIPGGDGFNGLFRALPGDEFVLSPSPADRAASHPGWDRRASAGLTPATGARTTRLCRTRSMPFVVRAERSLTRPKARPAIPIHAPALPRPPHPAPTFVTMANAPLNRAGRRGR
jgi:hypothetical protein